ncbi:MAG TPA: hypothetical protein H9719_08330 [Candidatus Intestinimonas stercoravium]|mgnify:CR=1 FL=1|uniref:hypothetical protein n=1 Tax=uncultured Intestinimonas sp. TaxID=1689265 RepID=UPI001F9F226F|nr:hypothetical protein [uncultured Intestinimonas sp.]HJA64121.1 hypothetical protein [Candidatus Intestinimonas stercoravium]
METVYYRTSNFIRHQGDVVDLEAYRRKLAAARRAEEHREAPAAEAPAVLRLLPQESPARRRARKLRRGARKLHAALDLGASLSVAVFAAVAVVQFLQL